MGGWRYGYKCDSELVFVTRITRKAQGHRDSSGGGLSPFCFHCESYYLEWCFACAPMHVSTCIASLNVRKLWPSGILPWCKPRHIQKKVGRSQKEFTHMGRRGQRVTMSKHTQILGRKKERCDFWKQKQEEHTYFRNELSSLTGPGESLDRSGHVWIRIVS